MLVFWFRCSALLCHLFSVWRGVFLFDLFLVILENNHVVQTSPWPRWGTTGQCTFHGEEGMCYQMRTYILPFSLKHCLTSGIVDALCLGFTYNMIFTVSGVKCLSQVYNHSNLPIHHACFNLEYVILKKIRCHTSMCNVLILDCYKT
jgi:hypothetical protein